MRPARLINYTITVANTGNTTLTGVVVTDPYADAGSIVRGRRRGRRQRRPARGRRDLGLHGGAHGDAGRDRQQRRRRRRLENIATADSNETGPDTDDATVPVAQTAALNIVKDGGAGAAADAAGELINYTITVANTGNTTLTGVVVTDPNADAGSIVRGADAVGDNDGLLEVGETWAYTAAHTVTQAEIDSNGGGDGAREHCDGGQQRDRSGHRRRHGAGGADRGAEHRQGRRCRGRPRMRPAS